MLIPIYAVYTAANGI